MASAPVCSTSNKEKGHALDTALDDWGADSGDYTDLVLYALKLLGPLCGPSRHKAAPTGDRGPLWERPGVAKGLQSSPGYLKAKETARHSDKPPAGYSPA